MSDAESCSFRIGQIVECVNDDFRHVQPLDAINFTRPEKGKRYTIRAMYPHEIVIYPYGTQILLLLNEIHNPMNAFCFEGGFYHARFRPIQTTDISVFTKLLVNAPKELAENI